MRAKLVAVGMLIGLVSACSSSGDGGANTGGLDGGSGTQQGDAAGQNGGSGGDGQVAGDGQTGPGANNPGGTDGGPGGVPSNGLDQPAVARGGTYFGFPERFNRYYTDSAWTPTRTVYVSPAGGGDGSARDKPMQVQAGLDAASAGTKVVFVPGDYNGCYEIESGGGTYDAPVVLYAERAQDGTRGVKMTCCNSGRFTCINLEASSYVAVDGFEFIGGKYGFRSVGSSYAASEHTRGNALLHSYAHDQTNDGVLTGATDWAVFEENVASKSGAADGHGVYLSNGSDFNIVRKNDLYDNAGATFQINADPESTCMGDGIAYDSPDCDALAGTGEGGRGASDYFLIEANYFHHGKAQGSNFTSARYSIVRNNIFGFWARHGVSFWSETDNPKLGSHHNKVLHNLFITSNKNQAVQFINFSSDCEFRNNLVVASGGGVRMETDDTVASNVYDNNYYAGGTFEGRTAIAAGEHESANFEASWFASFPNGLPSQASDLAPSATAPWLDLGNKLSDAPLDMLGKTRADATDLGPLER